VAVVVGLEHQTQELLVVLAVVVLVVDRLLGLE
jgi:hypothetical protein